jgi:D-alanine-D-alanine ligase
MKIALCCSVKKKDQDKPPDYFSEFDSEETVLDIASTIKGLGHEVSLVEANDRHNLINFFRDHSADIVFNIAEGTNSRFRESEVPALLDFLNIPYTGSNSFALALALNKAMAKRIFRFEGIPTPNFQIFHRADTQLDPRLKFPLIVKPNYEGSGKGISSSSVVYNEKGLYAQVNSAIANYRQEALVEEFIEGKELTVGVLANGKAEALPILEIDFSECHKSGEYFYSWKMKEFQGNKEMGCTPAFYCPARLTEEVAREVKDTALRAHKALGCFDISRTDIRLSKDNIPYVLEVNPLPGLDPKESNFPMIARAAGIEYRELIKTILANAMERYAISANNKSQMADSKSYS